MTLALSIICYAIQVFSLGVQLRKGWLLGIFISAYVLIDMIVFDYIVINGYVPSDFWIEGTVFSVMPMSGLASYAGTTRIMFSAISVLVLICSLGGKKRRTKQIVRDLKAALKSSRKFLRQQGRKITIGLLVLNVLNIIHLLSMDFSILWHNDSYQTIKSPEDVGITNPLIYIYHKAVRILGIITTAGYYTFSWNTDTKNKFLCMTFSLYAISFMVIGSSRWVVLYGVVALLSAYGFGKLNFTRAASLSILTLLGFVYVLYSRNLQEFGISRVIPNLLALRLDFALKSFGAIIVNAFEGALNFANALRISPEFTARYELLSLSPFPRFIDGFNQFDEIRIGVYAPMGGLGEVYFFGWKEQLVYLLTHVAILRLSYIADRRGGTFFRYGISLMGIFCYYLVPTYSARTTWKVLLGLLAVLIFWRARYKRARHKAVKGARQQRMGDAGQAGIGAMPAGTIRTRPTEGAQ